jgi:hypothetical protein
MNLRDRKTRLIRKKGQLFAGQSGHPDFRNRRNRPVVSPTFPDNGQYSLFGNKKFLFGQQFQGVIKTQPLYFRPIVVPAAKQFIPFANQLFVPSFGHI